MSLLLLNPQLADRSCADCAKYEYDLKTGNIRRSPDGKPKLRIAGSRTPCEKCPKKSPSREWEFALTPANVKTIQLYFAARATGGRVIPDDLANDQLLLQNLSHVDRIVSAWETTQSADRLIPYLAAHQQKIGR